jgi:hypothetical protein
LWKADGGGRLTGSEASAFVRDAFAIMSYANKGGLATSSSGGLGVRFGMLEEALTSGAAWENT